MKPLQKLTGNEIYHIYSSCSATAPAPVKVQVTPTGQDSFSALRDEISLPWNSTFVNIFLKNTFIFANFFYVDLIFYFINYVTTDI